MKVSALYEHYHRGGYATLADCYINVSDCKRTMLKQCKEIEKKYQGVNGRIFLPTRQSFYYGFETTFDGVKIFMVLKPMKIGYKILSID